MIQATSIITLLILALGSGSGAATAEEEVGFLRCTIEGVTNTFSRGSKAVDTPEEGLQVFAAADLRAKPAWIVLGIPELRLGTFTLLNTPKLTLHYSRSTYSSELGDYFDARREIPGTAMTVTLTKLGGTGETVEGRFFGVAANHFGQQVTLTKGTFRIVRSAASGAVTGREAGQPK